MSFCLLQHLSWTRRWGAYGPSWWWWSESCCSTLLQTLSTGPSKPTCSTCVPIKTRSVVSTTTLCSQVGRPKNPSMLSVHPLYTTSHPDSLMFASGSLAWYNVSTFLCPWNVPTVFGFVCLHCSLCESLQPSVPHLHVQCVSDHTWTAVPGWWGSI